MPFRNRRDAQLARLEVLEATLSEHAARLQALERDRAAAREAIDSAIRILEERAEPASEAPAGARLDEAKTELERARARMAERAPAAAAASTAAATGGTMPARGHRRWWVAAMVLVVAASAVTGAVKKWWPKRVPTELSGARLGMTVAELGIAVPSAAKVELDPNKPWDPPDRHGLAARLLLLDEPATCRYLFAVEERLSSIHCAIDHRAHREMQLAMVDRAIDYFEQMLGWPTEVEGSPYGPRPRTATWNGWHAKLVVDGSQYGLAISLVDERHAAAMDRVAELDREEQEQHRREAGEREEQQRREMRERLLRQSDAGQPE